MYYKPWAYVTATWDLDKRKSKRAAIRYCRKLYEAGFTPICPMIMLPEFLNIEDAIERKDKKYMSEELVRRSRIVVVCSEQQNEVVTSDIAIADRFKIPVTTLMGILDVVGRKG